MNSKAEITDMAGAKHALAPKLRFPAFRGTQGWDSATLGDLSEVFRGASPPRIDDFITSDTNGVNWLKIGDVNREAKYISRTAEKVRPEALSHTRIGNPEDLVLSNVTGLGKPYILQLKTCLHEGWIGITNIGNKVDGDFLYYAISAPCNQRYFAKNSAGFAPQSLAASIVRALPLGFPSIAEQKKIAECLSSLDELIATQKQKVAALKAHKNGLMQQLFPHERETQPRIRLPEFKNTDAWKVARLEDLATLGSGHTPSKNRPEYYNGGIKWVSLADSKHLDSGVITTTAIEISEMGIQNSSAVLHPAGSVLISREAGVGKSAVMGEPMAVSQHFIVWTCKPHLLSNWFLYYLLQNAKPLFERAATGSTIKNIGIQFFIDLGFYVPSLYEQQRIASCLSGLDTLTTLENQKLEVFKSHKKGLMQQLFRYSLTKLFPS